MPHYNHSTFILDVHPLKWTSVQSCHVQESSAAESPEEDRSGDRLRRSTPAISTAIWPGVPRLPAMGQGPQTPLTLDAIRGEPHLATEALPSAPRGYILSAQGVSVCARWTLRGVHVGDYGGIAVMNRDIAVESCEI